MQLEMRHLTIEDLEPALRLAWEVFLKFEAPDYSEEGIQEFKKYIAPATARERFESRVLMLGAFVSGNLAGVLEAGTSTHISMLFVAEKYHKQGIAKALFNEALAKLENANITVNSSPYAIEVYKKLGFVATGEEQTINGIRFLPMIRKP